MIMNEIMEDEKLTALFAAYRPELPTTDAQFMERLQRNIEGVERVRRYVQAQRRKNRLALIVAAAAGFVAGVAATLCFPYLLAAFGGWFAGGYDVAATWSVLGLGALVLTFSAYDIALAATRKFDAPLPQYKRD